MSKTSATISLIDLSKQLPYEIDDDTKKALCFAETLVISCCHVEGSPSESFSDLSWSCQESTATVKSEDVEIIKDPEPVLQEEELPKEEVTKELIDPDLLEDDFHFFFFDDLRKRPPPTDKDASVLIIDDRPEINPRKRKGVCLCRSDDEMEPKCKCWTTICTCGANTTRTCTCGAVTNICVCHPDNEPSPICTCGEEDVCTCHPDLKPRPFCTCCRHEPCLCDTTKYPLPFCTCGGLKPCLCHPPRGNTGCNCVNALDCSCKKDELEPSCICEKTEVCFCNPDGIMRRICTCEFPDACICDSKEDFKPICPCDQPDGCTCHSDLVLRPVCTCDNPDACLCDPSGEVRKVCVCGNPDACLCNEDEVLDKCNCNAVPCLCHKGEIREECICDVSPPPTEKLACTCKHTKEKNKSESKNDDFIKCHETDPHHTWFDYAYDLQDKFDKKPEKIPSKVNIAGLYDNVSLSGSCPVHDKPKYKVKTPRPFSLDCCSATGGLSISIECLGEEKDRFLVQVVAHFSKDGAKTSTKLVSIVDCNLHTLEENRTEQITKVDITTERRSYMAICTSGYYNKISQVCGEKKIIKRVYHSFEESHDFILEGGNMVLLRYIAVKRFKGEINTKTVLMGGSVCTSIYHSHGVSQGVVNGKPMFVIKVDRQIIEQCGISHEAKTVMTLKGRIISHEWSDNNYFLHVNPLLESMPESDDIQDTTPLRERWRDDMQLLSNYLEFKSAKQSENERYLSECEPLGNVIRDYLQTLLLLRPTDALHFTRHYFGSAMSSLDLPHDDYFDPCSRSVRYYYFEE